MDESMVDGADGVDGAMKTTTATTAAQARKRRMAARRGSSIDFEDVPSSPKRQRTDHFADDEDGNSSSGSEDSDPSTEEVDPGTELFSLASLASIKGIKKQARYVPEVPMTKEQVKAWRREARRIRNRESAAECRRKTRDRIAELERQLGDLEHKYQQAQECIQELQGQVQRYQDATKSSGDAVLRQRPVSPSSVSPQASPQPAPMRERDLVSALHLASAGPTQDSPMPLLPSQLPDNLMFSRPIAIGVS
jgi:hypothetical protein